MTDVQENRLSMMKAVQQVLTDNAAIIANPPAFATAKTNLDAVITAIGDAAEIQTKNIKGAAKDKAVAAETAIEKCVALCKLTKNYATTVSDNTLFQSVNYSMSQLIKIRDTALTEKLAGVKGIVSDHLTDLADYGVATADITEFATLIDNYDALLTAPRNSANVKAASTKAIATAFKNAIPVLESLDGFSESKKKTNVDFYNTYKSARVIVDSKGAKKKAAVK